MLRDVPLAEDLTQDALVAALEAWPHSGVPDNPGAWLVATAKRRGLDHLRRAKMLTRKQDLLEAPRADAGAGRDAGFGARRPRRRYR